MCSGGVYKKAQKLHSKRGTQVMKNERRAVVSEILWVERQAAPLSICVPNAAPPAPFPYTC